MRERAETDGTATPEMLKLLSTCVYITDFFIIYYTASHKVCSIVSIIVIDKCSMLYQQSAHYDTAYVCIDHHCAHFMHDMTYELLLM